MNKIFTGKVEKGKLKLFDKDSFQNSLLALEGEIELIVRRPKKGRSNNQNRYMWGVVYKLLSEALGYTTDEIHDSMRMLFLQDKDCQVARIRSTTSLTTAEMESYLASIRMWAAQELNVNIPEPNEVDL